MGDDAKSSAQGDGKQCPSASASNDLPEITEQMIHASALLHEK
jgi:hypothetical protein